MNRFVSAVIYLIIGLAVIGVVVQLLTNTISFLQSLLIMIGISILILGVIYLIFFKNRISGDKMKKYKKAVKQSKAKYGRPSSKTNFSTNRKQVSKSKKRSKKRPTHLRVIDGNKSKKKRVSK